MGLVAIIGGGIAGLATAAALAERGREVALFEKEPGFGHGSSGRSAAIFRTAVSESVNVRLALRSKALGDELVPGGTVRAIGAFYPTDDAGLRESILDAAAIAGVRAARHGEIPEVLADRSRPALFAPLDGVIDTHALVMALAAKARRHGARLRTGARVDRLEPGTISVDGEAIAVETIVDATGAWSPDLVPASDVGVRPHRRHLYVLDSPVAKSIQHVIWDLDEPLYLRPESGGVLVSPCDEERMSARDEIPVEPDVRALLHDRLSRRVPALADSTIRRVWAGLRPLTPDHRFVVGPDPVVAGLFRVTGFGGHGMTAGAAAGELAAAMLCGEDSPLVKELAPDRFAHTGVHAGRNEVGRFC